MEGDGVNFTDTELERIKAWVNDRMGEDLPCPLCSHDAWQLAEPKGRVMTSVIGGSSFPVAVLTCTNCSNTVLLNTIAMGIDKADLEEEKEAGDG